MIEVTKLTKHYGDRKAIDELNFSVQSGEVVGFLGPNGAGKTTTMRIITGFMPASSGKVTIDGQDVFEFPLQTKAKIGYLPETPPVYLDMSVQDYLVYVAQLKQVEPSLLDGYVTSAIEKTHLQSVRSRWVGNLSKGFRQRVGIAGAIVAKPPLLILDEPTVGLDPGQVAEIRNLILELKGEHTVLVSTHILSEVQATCERIIIINEGKIIAQDSLSEFTKLASAAHRFEVEILRKEQELEQSLRQEKGVLKIDRHGQKLAIDVDPNAMLAEELSKHIVDFGAGLTQFKAQKNDLEEIFIRLTSEHSKAELEQ